MSEQRPRLRPGTPVLPRPDGTVQVGIEDAAPGGIVLEGLSPDEMALLASLDGTRTVGELAAGAAGSGIPAGRVEVLLALLADHHLLDRPRAVVPARVLVDGSGSAVVALADLLGTAGLDVVWGPGTAVAPPTGRPSAVVLVRREVLDAREARDLLVAGVTHLPVVHGPGSLTVGPLVVPGTRGPCLACCELSRTDRDPGWSSVHTRLLPHGVHSSRPVGDGGALDHLAASLATMVLLAHVAGHPERPGVSHEVRLPWPRVVARQWSAHPACSCAAGRWAAPDQPTRPKSVTMAG